MSRCTPRASRIRRTPSDFRFFLFLPLCFSSPSHLVSLSLPSLLLYYSTNDVTCARYASITEVPERAVELFGEDRRRTWALLFMSEVLCALYFTLSTTLSSLLLSSYSLCVLTGRFGAVLGLNFIGGFRPDPLHPTPPPDPSDSNYNFLALEALHRIYVSRRVIPSSRGAYIPSSRGRPRRSCSLLDFGRSQRHPKIVPIFARLLMSRGRTTWIFGRRNGLPRVSVCPLFAPHLAG